jgi:hypothetical protein
MNSSKKHVFSNYLYKSRNNKSSFIKFLKKDIL